MKAAKNHNISSMSMEGGGQTLKLVKKSVVTTKIATNTSMISKGIVGTFLALALFSSTLSAKNGLFVGIDLGASLLTQASRGESSGRTPFRNTINTMKYSYLMPQIGFRLGYQHYFTPANGLRLYGSYAVARTGIVDETRNTVTDQMLEQQFYATKRLEANLDYLLDIVKAENSSAGVYLGVFYGDHTITLSRKNTPPYQFSGDLKQRIVGINLGLQMTLADHHRIEVGAKIPLNKQKVERIYVAKTFAIKNLYAYQLASVGLSYAFVF